MRQLFAYEFALGCLSSAGRHHLWPTSHGEEDWSDNLEAVSNACPVVWREEFKNVVGKMFNILGSKLLLKGVCQWVIPQKHRIWWFVRTSANTAADCSASFKLWTPLFCLSDFLYVGPGYQVSEACLIPGQFQAAVGGVWWNGREWPTTSERARIRQIKFEQSKWR